MTYIWTWEGWLFLAAIVDVFSRRVVGWAMADHLRTELPLRGLGDGARYSTAGARSRPPLGSWLWQYASEIYWVELSARGIVCNASTKGALNMTRLGFTVKELIGGLDWWKRDGYATEGRLASNGDKITCGCN